MEWLMKIRAMLFLGVAMLTASSAAIAARAYASEFGWYDANGVQVGSEYTPCDGITIKEGTLAGTKKLIWRGSCLCANGDCDGNP